MEKDYKQTGGRNREEGLEKKCQNQDGWQCWPVDILTLLPLSGSFTLFQDMTIMQEHTEAFRPAGGQTYLHISWFEGVTEVL